MHLLPYYHFESSLLISTEITVPDFQIHTADEKSELLNVAVIRINKIILLLAIVGL